MKEKMMDGSKLLGNKRQYLNDNKVNLFFISKKNILRTFIDYKII